MDVNGCKWTSWYIVDRWWDVKSLDLLEIRFSTCSSNQANFPSSISCIAIFSVISTPKLQTCVESNICLESQLECYPSYLSKPSNGCNGIFLRFSTVVFSWRKLVLVLMKISKALPRTGSIPAAIASRVPSEEQWLLWGLLWSNPAVNHVSQLHRSAPCDLNTSFDVRGLANFMNRFQHTLYMRLECCVYCIHLYTHTFVRCKASITHGIFLAIGRFFSVKFIKFWNQRRPEFASPRTQGPTSINLKSKRRNCCARQLPKNMRWVLCPEVHHRINKSISKWINKYK